MRAGSIRKITEHSLPLDTVRPSVRIRQNRATRLSREGQHNTEGRPSPGEPRNPAVQQIDDMRANLAGSAPRGYSRLGR